MFKRLGKYGAFLKQRNTHDIADTHWSLGKPFFFSLSQPLSSEHGKRETVGFPIPPTLLDFIGLKPGLCEAPVGKRTSVCRARTIPFRTGASNVAYDIYQAPGLFQALYYVSAISFYAHNNPVSIWKMRNHRIKSVKVCPKSHSC